MLLFVEVSTTYICLRWILYTHKLNRTICNTLNAFVIFLTFFFGRLVYQMGVLFGYGYPALIDAMQDEKYPWYKVLLLIFMFISLTLSAIINCYWMFLIVAQIKRIINRPSGEMYDEISQSEDGGGEPSMQGDESSRLIDSRALNHTPTLQPDDGLDTDDERDTLHISST